MKSFLHATRALGSLKVLGLFETQNSGGLADLKKRDHNAFKTSFLHHVS